MKQLIIILSCITFITSCNQNTCNHQKEEAQDISVINQNDISKIILALSEKFPNANKQRMERGVKQVASLWFVRDGSVEDFENFVLNSFIDTEEDRKEAFKKIQRNFEILFGLNNKKMILLMEPLHVAGGNISAVDMMFGSYNPGAHLLDDLFKNKIAFYVLLNYPPYSLIEKNENKDKWSRLDWAYARLGDVFTGRVPGHVSQNYSEISTVADTYISEYNIYMGNLLNNEMNSLFSENLKLITHWGLRDELKSNYADENGLEKQRMIYAVMKNIIYQEIPQEVINNNNYKWNPLKNVLYDNGKEVEFKNEPYTRYQHMLNGFKAVKEMDKYTPLYPTYIERKFDGDMEMRQEEVEKLFTEFVSSPQVKEVAAFISKRLGRDLEPFDIWYDGFKSRSSLNEADLDKITKAKYPNAQAFENGMPELLTKLGWTNDRAKLISSRINVDASRGAGHAWGSQMKGENARLRSRIGVNGMDYKGYNIAIHELGHNVEQTISLYDVDYYMMRGVPNTAFTEALAFVFQKRDLKLLGMTDNDPNSSHYHALDNFWGCYEIMGVSLVDMKVWKWLYENPDASAKELKEAVVSIAKEVWNSYYAPVFGSADEPVLAVYSHMIVSPLYLSAYPIGLLIEFQLDNYLEGKHFANEVDRIFELGSLTPQAWMVQAVGSPVSSEPLLQATSKAIEVLK